MEYNNAEVKIMKKFTVVLLSVLIACLFMPAAFAQTAGQTGEFSVFSYNVAGLPDIFSSDKSKDTRSNQIDIAKYVSSQGYDIFATQEDFGYNENLVKFLPEYQFKTVHHGGVPYGDGTNVYTKSFKMYNEQHITWEKLYGIADNGADELSQKGITYVCIEVADGVFVDFYNIHADAFGDEGSREARRDNFRQLAELINSRSVDRAVIVTGDFNEFLFGDSVGMKDTLIDGCGLKDAWVEVCNGGNYSDAAAFAEKYGSLWNEKWGVWDSVERFMYKDGGGVSLGCTDFSYETVLNRDGASCSDHNAAYAAFSYTVTESSDNTGNLGKGETGGITEIFRRITAFFKALFLVFSNFDEVRSYIGF